MDCVGWLSYGLCFSFAWVVMPVSERSDSARSRGTDCSEWIDLGSQIREKAEPGVESCQQRRSRLCRAQEEEASIRKRLLDELSARREVEAAQRRQRQGKSRGAEQMAAPQSEGRSCVPECCSAAAGMVRPQGYQGDTGFYWCAIARVREGKIPGKARGDRCWYSYAGKEHYTKDFEIMRGQSLSRTVMAQSSRESSSTSTESCGAWWLTPTLAESQEKPRTDAAGSRMVAKSMSSTRGVAVGGLGGCRSCLWRSLRCSSWA